MKAKDRGLEKVGEGGKNIETEIKSNLTRIFRETKATIHQIKSTSN